MADPVGTINDAGESSNPAPQTHSDELISTVDIRPTMDADTPPEGGDKSEAGTEGETAEGTGKEGKEGADGDDSRFDKHPRFIELNTRMKSAEETSAKLLQSNQEMVKQIAALTAKPKTEGKDDTELPYKDVTKMTEDELLDWQSEDPKGYFENQAKMVQYQIEKGISSALEKSSEQSKQKDLESQVEATYQSYAKENPDFDQMWDKGEIQAYMEAHPGHNAISAHMHLTREASTQKMIDDAVAKALADADKARRSTRKAGAILPSGPTTTPTSAANSDAMLKNPKQFGGDTSVLAERLERRRAQAGM